MTWLEDDNGQNDGGGEMNRPDEDPGMDGRQESVESETGSAQAEDKGRSKKKDGARRAISFDRAFAERFMAAEAVLSTKGGMALAQFITDSKSTDVAFMLAALSKRKTRAQIESLNEALGKLQDADQVTVAVVLMDLFGRNEEMRNLVFRVLNAAAPEKEFGRSSGDSSRDALSISKAWGDGVDIGVLGKLIV